MSDKPTLSFSNATLSKIEQYFDVEIIYSKTAFESWFDFKYQLSEKEKIILEELIEKHNLKLTAYLEEKQS